MCLPGMDGDSQDKGQCPARCIGDAPPHFIDPFACFPGGAFPDPDLPGFQPASEQGDGCEHRQQLKIPGLPLHGDEKQDN